jgi:cobalt/nickel transport system permease protein
LNGGGFVFREPNAMTLAFSTPPLARSFVSRLDPRWKLAALLFAAGVAATLHRLPCAVVAAALSLLLALLARMPARWFLQRLAALALVLAFFTLPLPLLLADDGPAWYWGPVRFSLHGAKSALFLVSKAVTIVTLLLIVQATAALETTLQAAHALRIPGLLVQLGLLTYRYVFVLADELARLRIALRVRGYRNRANRHSYRTAGNIAGMLLVRGSERAERVAQAMRCRGFDGQFRSLVSFKTHLADVVLFCTITAAAVALGFWDWLPRLAE